MSPNFDHGEMPRALQHLLARGRADDPALLPRRSFLKLVGASGLALGTFPHLATAQTTGQAAGGLKPTQQPSAFVQIAPNGEVTVTINRLEFGQGVQTGLPMILAEELDADWRLVRSRNGSADPAYLDPLFGIHLTGGSHSIQNGFTQYRELGARARAMLLSAAAARWHVDVATLRTQAGTVLGPGGRKANYGELAEAAMALPVPEKVTLKNPKDFRIIGRPTTRLDARAKSSGRQDFGIDTRLPGQLTAVVAHPPVFGATLTSVDDSAARAIKGVKAVLRVPVDRSGEGVAVVADGYRPAKQGRDALKLQWDTAAVEKVDSERLLTQYRDLAGRPGPRAFDADMAPLATAPRQLEAEFVCQSITTGTVFGQFQIKNGIDATATEGMREPCAMPMRLTVHHQKVNVPVLWWRSVGSTHTAFVMETLLDEIARATKQDPVAYRMHLFGDKHPRHRAALQLAVDKSGYGKKQLPAGRAWGAAVHESFDSVVAYVVEALGSGRPAGAASRDRRCALQPRGQPAQRGGSSAGRSADGPVDVPAGRRHHAQGRRRRAEQLRRLRRAAHHRHAPDRGAYRSQRGTAHRHGRTRPAAAGTRFRQCHRRADRQGGARVALQTRVSRLRKTVTRWCCASGAGWHRDWVTASGACVGAAFWPGPALGEQRLAAIAATATRGSAMLERMSAPPVRKISEMILDFGEPLFGQLDAALPLDAVQSIFKIVITVWNAHVMSMPRWGQPRFLADLHERMRDPQVPPEMVEAVRTLSQRRLERFASDGRAVGEWSLVMEAGEWRLRCARGCRTITDRAPYRRPRSAVSHRP